jgi:uncharacterized protein (TIGR03067 family)
MSHTDTFTPSVIENARSLDGWWLACSAVLGGVTLPPDALPGLAMVLSNRTLFLGSDIATIDIDRQVAPHSIDVLVVRGPNRWRFVPGIFRHVGSVLHMCLDLAGERRPSAFSAAFGSRHLVVEYRRAPLHESGPVAAEPVRSPGAAARRTA